MKKQHLLLNYAKAHAPLYVFAILMMISSNMTQAYFPKILGEFIDELAKGVHSPSTIYSYSWKLLGVGVAYAVLFGIGQYIVMRLGRRFEFLTRQQLFTHFTKLSDHYFSKRGIGALLSHVMNDVTAVRESISMGVNQSTNAIFLMSSTLVMMLLSQIPLWVIIVSMLPLVTIPFFMVYIGPKIRNRSMAVQESLATMTESVEEQFGGMRVTKSFAAQATVGQRFYNTVDQIVTNQLRLVRITSLFQAVLPFMGATSMAITIVVGGYLTIQHTLTLGNFVALTLYLRMMVTPLQQIGNVINVIQRSKASLERIRRLLAEVPDIQEATDAIPLPNGSLGLEIKDLTFRYPGSDQPALKNISLSLAPGHTMGIVGRTGSGKTTLMKLLLRLYDPPERTIFLGGTDIRHATIDSLRTSLAYVPQDGFLFSTTIRDNVAFSNRNLDLRKIEEAARQAFIYENIIQFPEKFDTKLGERGVTLSGGQRQRTSLARGFIKNAPFLLLDDSVSAVDAVTEKKIIETIQHARQGKTTLIIAHRISAVQHADEVIVLENGEIVERGNHQQLLAKKGIYASFFAIQGEGASQHA